MKPEIPPSCMVERVDMMHQQLTELLRPVSTALSELSAHVRQLQHQVGPSMIIHEDYDDRHPVKSDLPMKSSDLPISDLPVSRFMPLPADFEALHGVHVLHKELGEGKIHADSKSRDSKSRRWISVHFQSVLPMCEIPKAKDLRLVHRDFLFLH